MYTSQRPGVRRGSYLDFRPREKVVSIWILVPLGGPVSEFYLKGTYKLGESKTQVGRSLKWVVGTFTWDSKIRGSWNGL